MKKILVLFSFLIVGSLSVNLGASASDDHHKATNAKHDEHGHEEEDEHGHGKEDHHEEDEGDEHGHGHGSGKAVGPGKAITEVSAEKGFKLSPEAFSALEIKLLSMDQKDFAISKEMLVRHKNQTGIYRFRDDFFKFIPVSVKQQQKSSYVVHADELKTGDKIVQSPLGLIRITDVYSTDTAEYGHGH